MKKLTFTVGAHAFCKGCGIELHCNQMIMPKYMDTRILAEHIAKMMHDIENFDCPRCQAKSDKIVDKWSYKQEKDDKTKEYGYAPKKN